MSPSVLPKVIILSLICAGVGVQIRSDQAPPVVEWTRTFAGKAWSNVSTGTAIDHVEVLETSDSDYVFAGRSLIKIDSEGSVVWENPAVATIALCTTADGGQVAAVHRWFGSHDGIVKTDSSGEHQFEALPVPSPCADNFICPSSLTYASIQQTFDGGYILAGTHIDGDALFNSIWASLVKTDAAGRLSWIYYGPNGDANCVRQTRDRGYIFTGSYSRRSSHGDWGQSGLLLLKTTAGGRLVWVKYLSLGADGHAVRQTSDGGYIVAGRGDWGYLLMKTDPRGDVEWQKSFGSGVAHDVEITPDGGYAVVGTRAARGGGQLTMYIIKTDTMGELEWERIDSSATSGHSLQLTSDGGLIVSGTRGEDVVLVKLAPDCNQNGVSDATDFSRGTSLDCNANGLPDECDIMSGVAADCDGNGVPDVCDADANGDGIPDACLIFLRGDANADGLIDMSDGISTLGCLFLGTPCGTCNKAADSNDDGLIDMSDGIYTFSFLFLGAPPPPPPGDCGLDTTDDLLDCVSYAPCAAK